MKIALVLFFALFVTSFRYIDKVSLVKVPTKWIISEESKLIVNGKTNINRFSCAIKQYNKTDTIFITNDKASKIVLSGVLNIAVKNFDCNNIIMTKQLRKTLQEDKFPALQIKFLSLKQLPVLNQKANFIKGYVEIIIAGVAKKFEICYQINMEHNAMVLIGNQAINFSEFNLIAPNRMGKLIQAKDELIVAFILKMELVNQ